MPQILECRIGQEKYQKKGNLAPERGKKFEFLCLPPSSLFLRSKPVMWRVVAHPGRGIATRSPLSQSGAQSVSRWFLWNSTGYGSSKYMCQIALPTSGERDTRLNAWTERASLNVYHTSSLAARLLLSTFSASAVGIIRQIRQYVRRYVRNQTRVK